MTPYDWLEVHRNIGGDSIETNIVNKSGQWMRRS